MTPQEADAASASYAEGRRDERKARMSVDREGLEKLAPCPFCGRDALIRHPPEGLRPKVVCLCGSTRFTGHMLVKQWELTKQGYITLSWCALPEGYFAGDGTHGAEQEGIKAEMDELHKRKIDLADEVFVINLDGYIGESTRSEIEYAEAHGKPVRYLEADAALRGEGKDAEARLIAGGSEALPE